MFNSDIEQCPLMKTAECKAGAPQRTSKSRCFGEAGSLSARVNCGSPPSQRQHDKDHHHLSRAYLGDSGAGRKKANHVSTSCRTPPPSEFGQPLRRLRSLQELTIKRRPRRGPAGYMCLEANRTPTWPHSGYRRCNSDIMC